MTGFYISIGNVIIDDIVLPDGRSQMGQLGGGTVHAAMGMRAWSERVGLLAPVGSDFGSEQLAGLAENFDLSGLLYRSQRTPRAWQLFENDGTRTEVFRTSFAEMLTISPTPDELPATYERLAGVHLHCSPQSVPLWIPTLRRCGCNMILWEPWDDFCLPENLSEFGRCAALVDAVSPNLNEARSLTGLREPHEISQVLIERGVKTLALRMGAEGSLVADSSGQCYAIPAYPVDPLVDVTGAGNAYCGGFIVGITCLIFQANHGRCQGDETSNLQTAGWCGGVSASLALRQFGALYPLDGIVEETKRRLEWYRSSSKN